MHKKHSHGCLNETIYFISTFFNVKYKESDAHNEHPGLARRHCILTGQGYERLACGLTSIDSISDRNKQKITELAGNKKMKKEEKGYEHIKKSLSHDGISTQTCKYGMEEAHLSVAKYCDRFLRLKEDGYVKPERTDDANSEEIEISDHLLKTFPETITICLLNAMKLDSMEAVQWFPRLLQLVEYYPATMDILKKKATEVPCWMFILWISQMMALLDKPQAPAVKDIVLAIAREFPQFQNNQNIYHSRLTSLEFYAIVYPFKLSREGYTFGKSAQDKRNETVIEELAGLLSEERVPLISKFISALEQFGQPDQIFKDWGEDTSRLLKKKKRNGAKILEKYREMYEQLLESEKEKMGREKDNEETQSTQDSSMESLSTSASMIMVEKGNYPKQFLSFRKDVESYFGAGGKKLPDMSLKQFQKGLSTILFAMQQKGPPKVLEEYCQWMSDFNPNTDGRGLEIPGQYDGMSKPLPEYHVKIAGFDQRVLVLTSIRKPKRIIIRGNDEKEYKFLVKGGEDLRQDHRIEQLFFLMNKVFDKDPACRHEN
ncbi:LOW QUALITY PROTEIN: hypothetical protein KUTeg_004398 [Tegillarca granosa]|uniref:PI3K/PI4K catalytic domain-containing protein n=1 Tax=Tegillarca granosa TaxID=220873 RepID=A0ABQ9FRK1_TEGGR|nr:LOW QUALITY PROTEIN: hypothetical protein KUTeg_004398 [Tegillarca granosa]